MAKLLSVRRQRSFLMNDHDSVFEEYETLKKKLEDILVGQDCRIVVTTLMSLAYISIDMLPDPYRSEMIDGVQKTLHLVKNRDWDKLRSLGNG